MSARSPLGIRSRRPRSDVRPIASRAARRAALVGSSPTRSTPRPISRKTGKAPSRAPSGSVGGLVAAALQLAQHDHHAAGHGADNGDPADELLEAALLLGLVDQP